MVLLASWEFGMWAGLSQGHSASAESGAPRGTPGREDPSRLAPAPLRQHPWGPPTTRLWDFLPGNMVAQGGAGATATRPMAPEREQSPGAAQPPLQQDSYCGKAHTLSGASEALSSTCSLIHSFIHSLSRSRLNPECTRPYQAPGLRANPGSISHTQRMSLWEEGR